jgi:hypothetical protein
LCLLDYRLHFDLPYTCRITIADLPKFQTRSEEFKGFARRRQENIDHCPVLNPSVTSEFNMERLTLSSTSPTTGGSYRGASGPSRLSHFDLSSSVSGAGGGSSGGTEPSRGLLAAF